MAEQQPSQNTNRFQQELQRLRVQIDSLPPEKRPHLYELADVVERQHQRAHDWAASSNGASK